MGLVTDLIGKFPLAGLIKMAIGYISDLLEKVAPEELTPEALKNVQNVTGLVYAALKNFGPDWVVKTETDLDDAGLAEAIEICEKAAEKYDLQLNPMEILFG